MCCFSVLYLKYALTKLYSNNQISHLIFMTRLQIYDSSPNLEVFSKFMTRLRIYESSPNLELFSEFKSI